MAKLVCACLCLCVQLVVGQFGFFPPRENRGFSQSTLNPSRIRNTLQGILHLQPQAPNTNPAFVYPFSNRPTDRYGRPTYDYGRPNYEYGRPSYEYDRPNYEYGRPGITNNNMTPNQNQFSVPNRNNFQEQNGASQNGFQYPSSQNGFQYQQNQNGFQNPPNQAFFPSSPSQNEFPNNGNGFQNPPNQNGFQNQPSQNGFQEAPSQVGFPDSPTPNELPSNNGNGFQEYIGTNGDANSNVPKEDKQSDDTLIVIPGNTEENKDIFANSDEPKEEKQYEDTLIVIPSNTEVNKDIFASSDAPKEAKENEDTLIVITGNTEVNEDAIVFGGPSNNVHEPKYDPEASKATEESPKTTESTTVSVAPEYPPLTPVSTGSRNNFNFGPSGIFQETCTTVDNGVGSCLPVTECPPYLKMIQESRSNPNALRLLRQAHCGFQGTNPKVCCPRPGIPTDPPTSSTTTTEEAIVMPVDPEPSQEPKEPEPQPVAPVALPDPPVCGFSNASLSRVVGGIPAKLGDFPWMALLGYKERRAGAGARWLCGGSLISARHVLTAAHCIHTRENDLYLVRLGELDIARDDEGATPVDVLIKTNIKHEEYNPKSFTNDIGILVLSRNVQFTDLIQPICIPRTSELRGRSYENYRPLIAGWGDTEFRGPSATHLQVLQLPVVTNDYCAQAYSSYKAQVIDQRVLCAGFKQGKQDACQGDSGGPLMLPVQSSETRVTYFYQIGVVSYGKKCAEPGFPGVYTRVTNFVPWIEDTVARN